MSHKNIATLKKHEIHRKVRFRAREECVVKISPGSESEEMKKKKQDNVGVGDDDDDVCF